MSKSIQDRISAIKVPKVELALLANATPQDVSAWVLGRPMAAYKRDRLNLVLEQCEALFAVPGVRPEPTAQNLRRAIADQERKKQTQNFASQLVDMQAAAQILSAPLDPKVTQGRSRLAPTEDFLTEEKV